MSDTVQARADRRLQDTALGISGDHEGFVDPTDLNDQLSLQAQLLWDAAHGIIEASKEEINKIDQPGGGFSVTVMVPKATWDALIAAVAATEVKE